VDVAALTLMVNQIARNFAVEGDERAAAATAEHISLFWEPRMKTGLIEADPKGLNAIAVMAIVKLRSRN
jgi:formate dehydrogenase subunit delta